MRIECPYCGPRENGEFAYLGDAKPERPASGASEEAMFVYTYLRDNPAGPIDEWWYHAGGCRAWLRVRRDTTTHEIFSVEAAIGAVAAKAGRQ